MVKSLPTLMAAGRIVASRWADTLKGFSGRNRALLGSGGDWASSAIQSAMTTYQIGPIDWIKA